MPTYLQEFAFFADSIVVKTSQQALLGQLSPEDMAKQWADYLTDGAEEVSRRREVRPWHGGCSRDGMPSRRATASGSSAKLA